MIIVSLPSFTEIYISKLYSRFVKYLARIYSSYRFERRQLKVDIFALVTFARAIVVLKHNISVYIDRPKYNEAD